MGRINLSFGHLEGERSNSRLKYQRIETSTMGILLLLGNTVAVFGALFALLNSLCQRKR